MAKAIAAGVNLSNLVVGVCLPSLKYNASKFKVQYLLFDEKLKKHFRHSIEIYAHDPNKICKSGDMALIQELPNSMSNLITHKVVDVLYPFGDVTDPVTGKKVAAGSLRDDLETINAFYGDKLNSTFDYYKAPPRGWQEDKRDFTHRVSYIKYHEFDEDEDKDQPYAV